MSEHLPSGRRGQMLAIGLTAIIIALLWAGIVNPLVAWYQYRAHALDDRRLVAARMASIARTVPQLLQHAATIRSSAPTGQALVKASSDAVAGASLQQTMQTLAASTGITLNSVETLPAAQQGGYRRISLRITFSATWPVLIGLLQKLEVSTPRMLIDDIQFDASPDLVHPNGLMIAANFTVIAFRPGTNP